jgi:hypothetical protein
MTTGHVRASRSSLRGEWIRTTGLLVPKEDISTTYEHRSLKTKELCAYWLVPIWTLNGEAVANRTLVGPCLDPGFYVGNPVAFAHARSRAATPET